MKKIFFTLLTLMFVNNSVEAKLSSTKIKVIDEEINNVISVCNFDKKVLEEIKAKSVGSSISSGVASVASAGATATSVISGIKSSSKKNQGDSSKNNENNLKNLRLASTVASGVATGANLASVALSGTSLKSLAELMDISVDCNNALGSITLSE